MTDQETTATSEIQGKGNKCKTVKGLAPGAEKQLGRKGQWWTKGKRRQKVTVDPNKTVVESYENNNSKTGKIHVVGGPYVVQGPMKCSDFPVFATGGLAQ